MSIKSDKWIRRMAQEHGMIEPFEPGQVRTSADGQKIVSYGTSSYGYDIRCAPEFKVFTNIYSTVVDPKNFDEKSFVDINSDVCIIPPNSFALARTMEYFRIPRNVLTICLGKSTYARCGIIVNVTPFEPEWEGYVTLEFSNTTPPVAAKPPAAVQVAAQPAVQRGQHEAQQAGRQPGRRMGQQQAGHAGPAQHPAQEHHIPGLRFHRMLAAVQHQPALDLGEFLQRHGGLLECRAGKDILSVCRQRRHP
jgi:dCTP deaminase